MEVTMRNYHDPGSRPSRANVRASLTGAVILLCAFGADRARAQCGEQPFANYTGSGTVACPCFVAGEEAGAVFQLPADVYPVEILRVGIGWGSATGGAGQSLEQAVHIYAGGLPNPGTPIFTLDGPVLTDGSINEFNLGPLPGEIRIESGPFTVTLEFLNDNVGNFFAGSVVTDGNGCQGGKNVIFAIPGGWTDACAAGVTGDWVFYVTYRSLKVVGGASPASLVFSSIPVNQATCDTVYVTNTGCGTLFIDGITGCGAAPFSIDTTLTWHNVAPGGQTPIVVCATPTSGAPANCSITVVGNSEDGPIVIPVSIDGVTAASGPPAADGFEIRGVVPNPFNPETSIHFVIPRALPVAAAVWSVDGSRVRTLASGETFAAGENALRWDGRNAAGEPVASGVYLVRVETPLGRRVARAVLLE
jgi:hypothetical protein